METGEAVFLAAIIIVVGRWAKKEPVTGRVLVGASACALFLSAISASNPKLGRQFAMLILVSAGLLYIIPIAKILDTKYDDKAVKK